MQEGEEKEEEEARWRVERHGREEQLAVYPLAPALCVTGRGKPGEGASLLLFSPLMESDSLQHTHTLLHPSSSAFLPSLLLV